MKLMIKIDWIYRNPIIYYQFKINYCEFKTNYCEFINKLFLDELNTIEEIIIFI
jgi:hypothetical protein